MVLFSLLALTALTAAGNSTRFCKVFTCKVYLHFLKKPQKAGVKREVVVTERGSPA
jgi:hypothetical protein